MDGLRHLSPEEVVYTWWSFRANARANNAGWRIDYQMVTPQGAAFMQSWSVHKDPMFSDHAPMVIQYDDQVLA